MDYQAIEQLRRSTTISDAERARQAVELCAPDRLARPGGLDAEFVARFQAAVQRGEAVALHDTERYLLAALQAAAGPLIGPFNPAQWLGSIVGGRYLVEAVAGEGGFAVVYRGRHVETTAPVALKLLHPARILRNQHIDHYGDLQALWDGTVARFRREARTAACLSHPGIATVFDVWSQEEAYWLAGEYLTGSTLARVIARESPMDVSRAVRMILEAAAALDAAHARGVVHRDVNPSNIFLCTHDWGEQVKVLDFGVAKILRNAGEASTVVTEASQLLGTALYCSPEQFKFEDVAPASDVYSLAVVLYEMLVRTPPFLGSVTALATKHARHVPRDLRSVRADIPAGLADSVARALAKDPAERPRRARDFAHLLESAVAGCRVSEPGPRAPEPNRPPPEAGAADRFAGLSGAELALALAGSVEDADPEAGAAARRDGNVYSLLCDPIESAYGVWRDLAGPGEADLLWPALVDRFAGGDASRFHTRAGGPRP